MEQWRERTRRDSETSNKVQHSPYNSLSPVYGPSTSHHYDSSPESGSVTASPVSPTPGQTHSAFSYTFSAVGSQNSKHVPLSPSQISRKRENCSEGGEPKKMKRDEELTRAKEAMVKCLADNRRLEKTKKEYATEIGHIFCHSAALDNKLRVKRDFKDDLYVKNLLVDEKSIPPSIPEQVKSIMKNLDDCAKWCNLEMSNKREAVEKVAEILDQNLRESQSEQFEDMKTELHKITHNLTHEKEEKEKLQKEVEELKKKLDSETFNLTTCKNKLHEYEKQAQQNGLHAPKASSTIGSNERSFYEERLSRYKEQMKELSKESLDLKLENTKLKTMNKFLETNNLPSTSQFQPAVCPQESAKDEIETQLPVWSKIKEQYQRVEKDCADKDQKIKELEGKQHNFMLEKKTLETELERRVAEHEKVLERFTENDQQSEAAASAEIQRLERRYNIISEDFSNLKAKYEELESELDKSKDTMKAYLDIKTEKEKLERELRNERVGRKQSVADVKKPLIQEKAKLESRLALTRMALDEKEKELIQTQNELQRTLSAHAEMGAKHRKENVAERAAFANEKDKLLGKIQVLEIEKDALKGKRDALKTEVKDLKIDKDALETKIVDLETQIVGLQRGLCEVKVPLAATRKMTEVALPNLQTSFSAIKADFGLLASDLKVLEKQTLSDFESLREMTRMVEDADTEQLRKQVLRSMFVQQIAVDAKFLSDRNSQLVCRQCTKQGLGDVEKIDLQKKANAMYSELVTEHARVRRQRDKAISKFNDLSAALQKFQGSKREG